MSDSDSGSDMGDINDSSSSSYESYESYGTDSSSSSYESYESNESNESNISEEMEKLSEVKQKRFDLITKISAKRINESNIYFKVRIHYLDTLLDKYGREESMSIDSINLVDEIAMAKADEVVYGTKNEEFLGSINEFEDINSD